MKIILIAFIFILLLITRCSTQVLALTNSKENNVKDEDLLAKAMLYIQWNPIADISKQNYTELRNSVITQLQLKCNDTDSHFSKLSDYDLVWRGVLPYKFLLDSHVRTSGELKKMSMTDYLDCIIDENKQHSNYSTDQLKNFSIQENLNIAYSWWFNQNPGTKNIINQLNNVSASSPIFTTKDNRDIPMDCLKIIKADVAYTYLGVYHHMIGANHFTLSLAGSNDLKNWFYIADLGDRSHQGDLKKWGNGFLLANEQDLEPGSNNIRVRYYSSYANLIENNPSNDKSISRNFSKYAEGTPDIRIIEGSTPSESHILIGFHFYKNGNRDQQAIGILSNFSDWRAWKDEISNSNITSMGYNGNLGGRASFSFSGDYVLQEAQIASNDWSSWRILLGNGAFYYSLSPSTPLGSKSFANPGICPIGNKQFVVTSFMFTEGNRKGEIGELSYIVQF